MKRLPIRKKLPWRACTKCALALVLRNKTTSLAMAVFGSVTSRLSPARNAHVDNASRHQSPTQKAMFVSCVVLLVVCFGFVLCLFVRLHSWTDCKPENTRGSINVTNVIISQGNYNIRDIQKISKCSTWTVSCGKKLPYGCHGDAMEPISTAKCRVGGKRSPRWAIQSEPKCHECDNLIQNYNIRDIPIQHKAAKWICRVTVKNENGSFGKRSLCKPNVSKLPKLALGRTTAGKETVVEIAFSNVSSEAQLNVRRTTS